MSPLLVALLGVLLIPLFVAKWRASLLGLAFQGVLTAFVAYRLDPRPDTPGDWLTLIDLALVRGVAAPLALYRVMAVGKAPARHEVIPPNLLSWTIALSMALVSFTFAEVLVTEPGDQRTLVAVATSGVLLGFLVLATQHSPFSQMIGALRIENAIALLELGGHPHEAPLALQAGLLAVFVATVALFRWYLGALVRPPAGEPSESEAPTL